MTGAEKESRQISSMLIDKMYLAMAMLAREEIAIYERHFLLVSMLIIRNQASAAPSSSSHLASINIMSHWRL